MYYDLTKGKISKNLILFALPMMAGIIAGTFSSVFISGTIWAVMKGKKK